MRFLERLRPSETDPPFQIERGRRPGTYYAVFKDAGAAFEFHMQYPWVFDDCPIVHFGQYENAFDITDMRRNMN